MSKKKPTTTTEIPLATQGQSEATETPKETPATINAKALSRVSAEYDTLGKLDDAKRGQVFSLWATILHSGEATETEYKAALVTVKAARAAGEALQALSKSAGGLTATKALCVLVASLLAHKANYATKTPRILVTFDADACAVALADKANANAKGEPDAHKALKALVTFSVAEGQAKRGRKAGAGGKVSPNSRISAWKAAQDAAKDGCEFASRFKKDKEGSGYRDMGAGIGGLGRFIASKKDGGLVSYIFALAKSDSSIAKSALVTKLAKYNADKAEEAGLTVAN